MSNRAIKSLIETLRKHGVNQYEDGDVKITFFNETKVPEVEAVEPKKPHQFRNPEVEKAMLNLDRWSSAD